MKFFRRILPKKLGICGYFSQNQEHRTQAKIEENKKKPLKVGGFRARLQKALEEAEKQKKRRKQ